MWSTIKRIIRSNPFLFRLALPLHNLWVGLRHSTAKADPRHVFSDIYRKRGWGEGPSASGYGSSLNATTRIRRALPELAARHGIRRLIDAPCGDMHWSAELLPAFERYTGLDIVPEIIEANRTRFAGAQAEFHVADVSRDPLPSADCILCRDVFIHMPTRMILDTVRNIARSEIRFALFSDYPDLETYKEIPVGGCRSVNLRRPPFNFPEPVEIIEEDWKGKVLALWRVSDLARHLGIEAGPRQPG